MKPLTRSRSRCAALAVLAAVALAACGGDGKGKSASDGQVDGSGAAATKVARSPQELAKALTISVPDGYVLQPDQVGDTGPTDLEKAVKDDGEADARDVLTRTHFVRGYQRSWRLSEDDEIAAYVYQFADHAGAVEYTQRLAADAAAPADGETITSFGVAGIDGAAGVNSSDPTSASSSVTFVKGPYSVEMVVTGKTPTGLQSLVTALAEEQSSRL